MSRFKEMQVDKVTLEQVVVTEEVSAKPGKKVENILGMDSHIDLGWAGP